MLGLSEQTGNALVHIYDFCICNVGSSTFPTEWQQFFFRCRSFDNFDGTVNLQSNIGNIRNWSLANRRNRFLSESSNSTSFGRSESGELMPSINGSRDHDACTNQTTRSSPSDDVMKSPWHSDHLSDKGGMNIARQVAGFNAYESRTKHLKLRSTNKYGKNIA